MAYKTEKTVPNVSVGADTEQSSQKCTVLIITDFSFNFNMLFKIWLFFVPRLYLDYIWGAFTIIWFYCAGIYLVGNAHNHLVFPIH